VDLRVPGGPDGEALRRRRELSIVHAIVTQHGVVHGHENL
jgi:hypothetical protein